VIFLKNYICDIFNQFTGTYPDRAEDTANDKYWYDALYGNNWYLKVTDTESDGKNATIEYFEITAEVMTNPLSSDSDNDGLTDLEE